MEPNLFEALYFEEITQDYMVEQYVQKWLVCSCHKKKSKRPALKQSAKTKNWIYC